MFRHDLPLSGLTETEKALIRFSRWEELGTTGNPVRDTDYLLGSIPVVLDYDAPEFVEAYSSQFFYEPDGMPDECFVVITHENCAGGGVYGDIIFDCDLMDWRDHEKVTADPLYAALVKAMTATH